MPTRVNIATNPVIKTGPMSIGPLAVVPAALLLVLLEAVAVALPEPGLASPVLVPLAFCEPSPVRPGPVPAPEEKN